MFGAISQHISYFVMAVDIVVADMLFYFTLAICIGLGTQYKRITNKGLKRNYGTGLGLVVTYIICGSSFCHSAFMVWGNIIIIKCGDKHYLHQLSLAYTWIYLIFMNYTVDYTRTPYVLWLHQVIALRLVGMAFEVYLSSRTKVEKQGTNNERRFLGFETLYSDSPCDDPSALDIIAYAYYFIGLHRGPYYKWKAFEDHFNTPFATLGNYRAITEKKLKEALIYSAIYVILLTYFPSQKYYDDEFYETFGPDDRYLYNLPQLAMYCLQYQIIMLLSSCTFTESGFGVYPAKCVPLPGLGPSVNLSLVRVASWSYGATLREEFTFGMLKSFDNDKLLFGPRMRDTLKGWDMSTRYWFWAYTYKNIIKSSKDIRSTFSFLAWSLWCGPSVQQLIISTTIWVHINLESEYSAINKDNEAMKVGFTIMRVFCLIYLTPCFVLPETTAVMRYYFSIYWMYHLILMVLVIVAVLLHKLNLSSTT